jgi:aryl-alcohol dehydrogenase-like predicted oxidoreductase
MTLFPNNKRYFGEQGQAATAAYVALAREHGLDPVLARPFLTSAIVGATDLSQLENSIAAKDLVLSEEVLNAIESLHKIYTYPCP